MLQRVLRGTNFPSIKLGPGVHAICQANDPQSALGTPASELLKHSAGDVQSVHQFGLPRCIHVVEVRPEILQHTGQGTRDGHLEMTMAGMAP